MLSSVDPRIRSFRFNLIRLYVTCLGIGHLPVAPGTWASLAAVVFWALLIKAGLSMLLISSLLLLFFIFGIWGSRLYEKETKSEDSSEIVIDEWVGMGIALLLTQNNIWLIIAAFVLFRFFDITKPPGVRYFDKNYMEGWGVMLDDVVAGVYACLLIGIYHWFSPVLSF